MNAVPTMAKPPVQKRRASTTEGKQIRVTNEAWEALRQARVELIAETGVLMESYSDVILALIRQRSAGK